MIHKWSITLAFACAPLAFPSHAAGPVVLLIGGPGAGKTTQTQILQKERGMAIISADDLIAHNHQVFEKFRNPSIQGVDPKLDPALNELVEEALKKVDLSKGVVLDGYPAAKIQGDYLTEVIAKLQLPGPVVIHLHISDDVARKRLKSEKGRNLDQELKDYHREMDFARTYFPEADIHDVDGNQKPEVVAQKISKIIESAPKSALSK